MLDFKSQQQLDIKIQQALPLELASMPRLLGLMSKEFLNLVFHKILYKIQFLSLSFE